MSKVVSIDEGGNVATLLSFRDPSRANAQLVRELNALSTVRVNGINIEVDKLPDAIAAVAKCRSISNTTQRVEQLFSRWKYLFQRPYETSMDECSTRVDIMIESLIDLPADCIMHIYNQSLKSFRILPPYSDVYALVKKEYEMRKIYLELFSE